MSVDNNQDTELEELKQQAEDLGISVHPKIGAVKLQEKIDDAELKIAQLAKEKKEKRVKVLGNKVKIVVESREGDDAPVDQFFGFTSMETGVSERILIQFGEEIEVSEQMFEHMKNIKFREKKFKVMPDEDGIPRKHWYKKEKTRFIVSKV